MGYFKPLFILDGNNTLRLSNVPLPEPSRVHVLARYLARKSSLVSELRYFILRNTEFRVQRYMPLGDRPAPRPEELHDPQYAIRLTVALLDRIRAVAEAHGSRVLVVVSDVPSDSPYHELVPQLARAGIEVFEVNESTGFSPAYMLITHDGHWNAAGHAFVADKLAGLLKEKGFSP
jgi:hypothetical protein